MTTLANATALLIASSERRGEISLSETGQETWGVGLSDMIDILGDKKVRGSTYSGIRMDKKDFELSDRTGFDCVQYRSDALR